MGSLLQRIQSGYSMLHQQSGVEMCYKEIQDRQEIFFKAQKTDNTNERIKHEKSLNIRKMFKSK